MKLMLLFLTLAPHALNAGHDQLIKDTAALSTVAAYCFFQQAQSATDPVTTAHSYSLAMLCALAPCTYIVARLINSNSEKHPKYRTKKRRDRLISDSEVE